MCRTDVGQRHELCYIISFYIDGGSKLSSMLISSHNQACFLPLPCFYPSNLVPEAMFKMSRNRNMGGGCL